MDPKEDNMINKSLVVTIPLISTSPEQSALHPKFDIRIKISLVPTYPSESKSIRQRAIPSQSYPTS